ncbi:FLYWCH-type zinc finger-containing protein 1-like [Cydia fagiglandana]|uniref:FLYWCH-type zinc finger-containing protein 1-like n=1 Tax=Cydia fagiglandana TaxID=1458189 RepID=UPI002FEDF992
MAMHHGPARHGEEVYCQAVHRRGLPGEFLWTKRGGKHPLLLFSGYTYSYQKENALGRISWYCSRRLKGCRASAVSYGTRVFAYKPHDHPPPRITMGSTETQQESDPHIFAVYTKSEAKQ